MVYTNIRSIMKWWYPHTKRLKYCSYANFDEHVNKFGKGWSPVSELMLGTNISILMTLKIDLSYHPFVKYVIFGGDVNFPPRGTIVVIITQYCEHHNISYISQSENNSQWNHAFPARNSTNVCILGIGIKELASVQQVLEAISSQQFAGK